jgi:hypothetical protein
VAEDYSKLISAISDVGYWRWWSERLPEMFQIEFGGVQIYVPLGDSAKPPSGLLAIRFSRPSRVSFLRKGIDFTSMPQDWPQRLKDESLDVTLGVSYEEFAIGDATSVQTKADPATSEIVHFNDESGGREAQVAFWCGDVGLNVSAAEFRFFTMKGEVLLAEIEALHNDWWTYWRDYWNKLDTPQALPKDYACDVTIPIRPS